MTIESDVLNEIEEKFPESRTMIKRALNQGYTPEEIRPYIQRGLKRLHRYAVRQVGMPDEEFYAELDQMPTELKEKMTYEEWRTEIREVFTEVGERMLRLGEVLDRSGLQAYLGQLSDDSYIFSEEFTDRLYESVIRRIRTDRS